MTQIDAASVVAPRRHVHAVLVDGEAVVLDKRSNRLHRLNPAASLVWACLDGTATVAAIAEEIAELTAVDLGVVLRDVVDLCGALLAEGIVDVAV